VVEDQEQIGAELADAVVNRLHAAGLALHKALSHAPPGAVAPIGVALSEIDSVIRMVRHAVSGSDLPGESG
jgi:hypothetical protein